MKTELFELPTKSLEGYESPSVSALHSQQDGSILCGVSFSNPSLFRLKHDKNFVIEDLGLEEEVGSGCLGVMNGLWSATSGDTAFAVLHEGFAPGFLKKLAGGDVRGKSGPDLIKNLLEQDGGMGASVRHSVVQIVEGEFRVRRFREPGALMDAAHIGDFIFGLCGTSIWREPYLNAEKRETLRKDLVGNLSFHRDGSGNFWFQGQNGRLLRMGQTDIKAKPTTQKIPKWTESSLFEISAASPVDEWLYGVSGDSKVLFRVRVNPVSNEEEMQVVGEFAQRITGIAFQGEAAVSVAPTNQDQAMEQKEAPAVSEAFLAISLESPEGAEIRLGRVTPSEDPEMSSALPELKSLGRIRGVNQIGSLTFAGKTLWAGEGRLGMGTLKDRKPRIVKITEII